MRTKINQIKETDINKKITVKGWLKSIRNSKKFSFAAINDGSCFNNLQIIIDASFPDYENVISKLSTGTAISTTGNLVKSPGGEQAFELQATNIEILGECDSETYPLQKKRHSFEFLRTIAHLRPRTNTIGAVARVRNALSFATHKFFQDRGFLYVNTPIISSSDCEGAGQMFKVTTLDPKNPPLTDKGNIDYSKDFFERPTFLTVSGQLEAETYACSLSDVYTFSPTFRAENSNTSTRYLAEFWMIEPEMAFADLKDNMDCAESYLKYCLKYILENCPEDMVFFNKFIQKGLIERSEHIINTPFGENFFLLIVPQYSLIVPQ